jgi:hypothetical protein
MRSGQLKGCVGVVYADHKVGYICPFFFFFFFLDKKLFCLVPCVG